MNRPAHHAMSICLPTVLRRAGLRCVALLAMACVGAAACAQTTPTPPDAAASAPADSASAPRDRDRQAAERGVGTTAPQALSDAPTGNRIPGQPPPRVLRFDRGPLELRRAEFSFGFDQLLSRQWAIGALFGQSTSRARRTQTEVFLQFPQASPAGVTQTLVTDTELRGRNSSATLTLSWFPTPGVFVDASLAAQISQVDASRRFVSNGALLSGSTRGDSRGWSLGAGMALPQGAWTLVPQLGLDAVRASVDPIDMDRFRVGAQAQRSQSLRLALQVQRSLSQSFGTLTPYAQLALRRQLSFSADKVTLVAPGTPQVQFSDDTRVLDPEEQLGIRRATSLGLGMLLQWTGGYSGFVEWSKARGSESLRDSRIAVGVKISR